jgi:alcohol/geraniol dehydrogenase (NADP+)
MTDAIHSQTDVKFSGYSCNCQGSILELADYKPQRLSDFDVEIAISHCGICHSDLHLIDNDWKITSYPFIPGHEIVGLVRAKGTAVSHLNIGDRVGIGWQCSGCFTCDLCTGGYVNLCPSMQPTCVGRNGGFANGIRVDSRFAFLIPSSLNSENAAPLLCGGATVYSPFVEHNVKPRDRVAIVGVGGLGHLAIQFAHAMGCEVTAISHSADKEEESRSLGAHRFVDSSNSTQMDQAKGTFDFILSTVSAEIDWQQYVELLCPNGLLCFVGAPPVKVGIFLMDLIAGQKRICGSAIASPHRIKEMLNFAARHDIQAMTELFPVEQVNEAIDRLRRGQVRYRAVLKM